MNRRADNGKRAFRVRVEALDVPLTSRLATEAARWASHGRRPEGIILPEPGQESVWDYPRPPALQRVLDRITVEFAGRCIADTTGALRVCETASPPTYYIPAADVRLEWLRSEAGASICEWKGRAIYYSLMVPLRAARQAFACERARLRCVFSAKH